jgi:hypothetical protein
VPPTRESFVALQLAQEVARIYELRCTKEVNVLDRLQALLEGGADGVMDPEDEDEDEDLRMVRADVHMMRRSGVSLLGSKAGPMSLRARRAQTQSHTGCIALTPRGNWWSAMEGGDLPQGRRPGLRCLAVSRTCGGAEDELKEGPSWKQSTNLLETTPPTKSRTRRRSSTWSRGGGGGWRAYLKKKEPSTRPRRKRAGAGRRGRDCKRGATPPGFFFFNEKGGTWSERGTRVTICTALQVHC